MDPQELASDALPDDDQEQDRASSEIGAASPLTASTALDRMPMTLAFELGQAHMLLGEVRTLAVGAVILLEGGVPGSLTIVCGGRTLGRGEAVDVNGQPGVRLTHWGAEK